MGRLIIIAIVLFALALRLAATYPGYPPYHSDEGISYSAATSMLKNNNLDPLRYDYPALTPLLNLALYKTAFIPASWILYGAKNIGPILDGYIKIPLSKVDYNRIYQLEILGPREINALTWSRIITALFSTLSVVLVYVVGKTLNNKLTGIIAAAFLAVNYRAVLNGVLGLPDTYNAFFLLLSFLMNILLYKKRSLLSYQLAGAAAGLSLSVKYQPFGLLMLGFVHLLIALEQTSYLEKLKKILTLPFFYSISIAVLIFLLLNPYMFIHFEETVEWLVQVAGKYRPRRYQIDFYGISYLYHFGLGKITSLLCVLSLLFLIIKPKTLLLLLSVLFPFFYVTVYYSGAGFYTRNFVTITPFLLLCVALMITALFSHFGRFKYILVTVVVVFLLTENIQPSLILASEYRKQWNFETLSEWIEKNIPQTSKVAAHSSVPLPFSQGERLPFDFNLDFSLAEFQKSGANFAIINFDWATNDFYWWMTQSSSKSLTYWNKPIEILSEMYPAKAIRELLDYSVYAIYKNELAPESDFVVAVIPTITFTKDKMIQDFDFGKGTERWTKTSAASSLKHTSRYLQIEKSVPTSPIDAWESEFINVDSDVIIEADMETLDSRIKDGFIYIKLYPDCSTSKSQYNRIRLSARNEVGRHIQTLPVKIPSVYKCAILGFQSYNPQSSESRLYKLSIYSGSVDEQTGSWRYNPVKIPDGIVYPNSHGNL